MPPPQALSELLRTFVQEAAVVLSEDQQANPLPVGAGETWERGGDGYFRRVVSSTPEWSWVVVRRWDQVQKLPAYVQASEALVSDHKVGPQMDKLVGAVGLSCQTIEIDHILRSCIETAVTSEGRFSFDLPRFETRWSQIWNTLSSDTLPCVLVAPLPGFSAPNLPVKLDPDLVIDKFIDDEVRQCTAVGLLPVSPLFPIIRPEDTVGIRWTAVVRKVVSDEWSAAQSKPKDVGVFGRRPVRSSSRLADDVLVALRLLKAGSVSSPGTAHSCRAWMLEGGIQFSHRPGREFQFGDYTLNEEEVVELQRLWKTLTSGVLESKRFRFLEAGLRRFNFAFERFASEDRLVDLLIAAESLFLHDGAVPQERGELRFRLALRASKFIKHPTYTERETYKIMRHAYDARSAVVHGGEVSDTRLPGQENASLTQFTDAVEEIMRRALREATDLAHKGVKFDKDFWEALLFGEDTTLVAHLVVGAS